MKKIILAGIILGFFSCKNQDSVYEEYIVPNGYYYPAKALEATAHPGRERIEISWKNGADPKVVKASISWNNDTESVEINVAPGADIISRMIEPIDENTYSFLIRTYDAKGNASVPVEVMGTVYGEDYERSLMNRSLKSAVYDENGILTISWNAAEDSETGIALEYTDINGNSKTWLVEDPTETITTISDFKAGTPLFCSTMHKPDSLAIDIFSSSRIRLPYSADITNVVLKDPRFPFAMGAHIMNDRWYLAANWIANAAAAANGNIDNHETLSARLTFIVAIAGQVPIENGKLYQTVELEAGTYRFDVWVYRSQLNQPVYLVVASGDDLPDTNVVEQEALRYILLPNLAVSADVLYSMEFVLPEKQTVSLGFLANGVATTQVIFSRVALSGQF